jgi:hypothetical protein
MRRRNMKHAIRLALLVLASLGCASTPPPQASGAVDWPATGSERVPSLVTVDEDGSERVTKLWLVVVDGEGYVRTGNSRWFRNIERDPNVVLRIDGEAYALRAERVDDAGLTQRLHGAFREKYGWQDWIIHPFGSGDANLMRLVPRAAR